MKLKSEEAKPLRSGAVDRAWLSGPDEPAARSTWSREMPSTKH